MKTIEMISKDECCGCKLCESICPKNAIGFGEGELGVVYPKIDEEKCIDCGACVRLCPAKTKLSVDEHLKIYAAINCNKNYLLTSASGGVFSALAERVLNASGVVYGAAMLKDNEFILKVKHIRIDRKEDLHFLQKSKYVQSDMSGIYENVKEDIRTGKLVLFSGTPCQIAAVKSACGTPTNLVLVEVICHGVPSQRMFTDYLYTLKNKNEKIEDFRFRTKESGWGLCAELTTRNQYGKLHNKRIPCNISSFYKMFLRCEIYRESCYQCKYAVKERVADLTIGDYWGIEKDPEVYNQVLSLGYKVTEGISCVIASTEKGKRILKDSNLELIPSSFESISKENGQLVHPSKRPESHGEIVREYSKNGYAGLDKKFNRVLGIKKYVIILKNKIPPQLRFAVKKMLKK